MMTNYIEKLNVTKRKLHAPDEFPKPSFPAEVNTNKVPEITHIPNEAPIPIPIEHPEPDVPDEQPDEKK